MDKKKPGKYSQKSRVDDFIEDLSREDINLQNKIKFKTQLIAFTDDEKRELNHKVNRLPDKKKRKVQNIIDDLS